MDFSKAAQNSTIEHTLKRMDSPSNLVSPNSELQIWQTSNHHSRVSCQSSVVVRRLFEVNSIVNRGMQKKVLGAGILEHDVDEPEQLSMIVEPPRKRSTTNRQHNPTTLKTILEKKTPTLKVDLRSAKQHDSQTFNSSIRSEGMHSVNKNKNILFKKCQNSTKQKLKARRSKNGSSCEDHTNNSQRQIKTSASVRLLTVNLSANNTLRKNQNWSSIQGGIDNSRQNTEKEDTMTVSATALKQPHIRSARLRRHLQQRASQSPADSPRNRYSTSASRLLENARFIEQGHLDSLIKSTMKSVERIIAKDSNKQ